MVKGLTLTLMFITSIAIQAADRSNENRKINGISASELEGKKYRVFKDLSYIGIRELLNEGEWLTISNVRPHEKNSYFFVNATDENGRTYDIKKRMTMKDFGLLDERLYNIDVKVDYSKVIIPRGKIIHGLAGSSELITNNSIKFISEVSKDKSWAYQVGINNDGSTYETSTRMEFVCEVGKINMNYISNPNITWDKGLSEVYLSFPYYLHFGKKELDYRFSNKDRNWSFVITDSFEKFLLKSFVMVYSYRREPLNILVQSPYYLNGLAEAYKRVKQHCKA
jgi:hypothetical protein